MYVHQRSGLNLTLFRAYNPALARWLSRDPLGESMGTNLYDYVGNSPVNFIDTLGLFKFNKSLCQQLASMFADMRDVARFRAREIGVSFNVNGQGVLEQGPVSIGASWKGPVTTAAGYSNIAMTHTLGGVGPIWIPFTGAREANSGFAHSDWVGAVATGITPWAINRSNNIFVIDEGHLFMMEAGCEQAWNLGTEWDPIAPGVKSAPCGP